MCIINHPHKCHPTHDLIPETTLENQYKVDTYSWEAKN